MVCPESCEQEAGAMLFNLLQLQYTFNKTESKHFLIHLCDLGQPFPVHIYELIPRGTLLNVQSCSLEMMYIFLYDVE